MHGDFPFLSLKEVAVDPSLTSRIPRDLAYFHQALPIAEDENVITLAMVHPHNEKVVALFEERLGCRVVPVRGDSAEILGTLALLYPAETEQPAPRLLSWSEGRQTQTLAYAQAIGGPLKAEAVDASQNSLESVLNIARDGRYTMTVLDVEQVGQPADLLKTAGTTLLFRGNFAPPRRILLALQGHSPDTRALEIAGPLAIGLQAPLTLLGVAAPRKGRPELGLPTLLDTQTTAGEHLATCAAHLAELGVAGQVKLRQGNPDLQVAAEFQEGGYDLLVIAVETYGNFVGRIWAKLADYPIALLAVKPTIT